MTPFLTTNWHKSGGPTKALDDACANAAEKAQNVRRRIIMNVPKSAIGMEVHRATALLLVLFTLCASLVGSAHAEQQHQQQQQQPDEFVALQYPETLEESLLPYPSASTVDNDEGKNLFLQKRFLVPPRRMLKLAQMMKNGGRRRAETAAADARAETETEQDAADINGEQGGQRWRQNNGGAWAKRHIKDSSSPAGFQKMDEFKNNMMRALINLRRYRR
uniref:Uncharacterized protein n=1 Tax=Globodera rostochiensis TaxID=31243 RepID=A0A914HGM8_GLORO